MTDALDFLADSLLTLYLYVLILRFVMQLSRADFRSQIGHAVMTVTNPLIMPLRRVFPPVGKVDTASVLAIILFGAIYIGVMMLIRGHGLLDPLDWTRLTALTLLRAFIMFYFGAVIIYAILGWVVPQGYSPPMALLASICEPVLAPFRRIIPPIGGIDFSPLWVTLLLGVVLRLFGLG